MLNLNYQTALIIGATGGIGEAVVKALSLQGATVIISGRNGEQLTELANQLSGPSHQIQADISEPKDRQRLVAFVSEFANIDYVINLAGTNQFSLLTGMQDEAIARIISVNLIAHISLIRDLLPKLISQERASIINVGSTLGSIGLPGYSVYAASKFGLRGFSEALNREVMDTGVSVRYFAPRATSTKLNNEAVVELNKELGNAMDSPEQVAELLIKFMVTKKKQYFLGWPEKLFVKLNALMPSLVDNAIGKQLPIFKKYL